MLPEKYNQDLDQLKKIAQEQENQINFSFVAITIKPKSEEIESVLEFFEKNDIEVIFSDVEPDHIENTENLDSDNKIKPFDPNKIDIKMDKMTIDSLIRRIEDEAFEFTTDFQRKAGLWKNVQKSQLIESLLLRIPLPAFYFDASDEEKYLIIDGLQRVTTIKEFVVEQSFELIGMEFLKELNGLKFKELPRSLQRRIEETNINTYLVSPTTPSNVKFNIFKRINTGGLTLEAQEIRNALYQGHATKFINELAKQPAFLKVTDGSIKVDRMLDREFCLRYVAFTCLPLSSYNGVVDDFLNDTMVYLNETTANERERITSSFIRVMTACHNIFGKHAFRKMSLDGRRRPINKALYETWSLVIYSFKSSDSLDIIINNKYLIQEKFIDLCEQHTFTNALKGSERSSVSLRIKMVLDLVKKVLEEERTHD
ncbi:DUF262 domain-containing protein [Paenibacillus sp. FSL R7-0313]|uniref:DUF262 domain-containing protein n=1 Tax=Paenibacillus sp. FSL R7-0313 TaxID=2954532 RepID=UPI0030DDC6F3